MAPGVVSYVNTAATGAAVLIAGVAVFQAALALGLPLGDATLGGRARTENGVLAPGFRVLAVVQAILLLLIAWVILARAGVMQIGFLGEGFLRWITWGILGFLILNTVANLAAPHPVERWVMGSITLVVALLTGVVAFGAPG